MTPQSITTTTMLLPSSEIGLRGPEAPEPCGGKGGLGGLGDKDVQNCANNKQQNYPLDLILI